MNQSKYRSNPELKNTAKEYLAGQYGVMICMSLAVVLLMAPITFAQSFVENSINLLLGDGNILLAVILLHLISIVFLAFSNLFSIGILLVHLKIACKQPYDLSDLLYCFFNGHFQKAFLVSLGVELPAVICTLPFAIVAELFWQKPSVTFGFYALLSLILGMIVYIPISLGLSMSYFLMLDFPEYSAGHILSLSFRIMKGQKGRLFFLEMSFLPLLILCVFSMFIGNLWLTPYMDMTHSLFFLNLMQNQEKQPVKA